MAKSALAGLPRVTPIRIYLPFLFWLITIFALSAYPKAIIPQSRYISWDKIAHLVEYAILGYLASRAAYFSGSRFLYSRWLWIGVLFGIIYAISDEYHQLYVPGRIGSPYDVVADSIGVLLGVWLFRWSIQKKTAKRSKKR
jgi:VanZ family protein